MLKTAVGIFFFNFLVRLRSYPIWGSPSNWKLVNFSPKVNIKKGVFQIDIRRFKIKRRNKAFWHFLHYYFYASLLFHNERSNPENFSSPYLFSGPALEKLSWFDVVILLNFLWVVRWIAAAV